MVAGAAQEVGGQRCVAVVSIPNFECSAASARNRTSVSSPMLRRMGITTKGSVREPATRNSDAVTTGALDQARPREASIAQVLFPGRPCAGHELP